MTHQLNIFIHIGAGSLALIIGAVILFAKKGTPFHRKWGKYFVVLLSIVVSTGFFGWLFFRTNHFLLMLTILAGYNTLTGYWITKSRERRAAPILLALTFATLFIGSFYVIWLMNSDDIWNKTVIYSTVSALILVTTYDLIKGLFLHVRMQQWWLYEHIYKMVSAFSAILSAFTGTVLPDYKPYSQVAPSGICMMLIVFFIYREYRKQPVLNDRYSQVHKQPVS
jgi:hypothetical protein